jgi:hypothetical protein
LLVMLFFAFHSIRELIRGRRAARRSRGRSPVIKGRW